MKRGIFFVLLLLTIPLYAIRVSEAFYEGSPHYIIKTRSATYWFDMKGGGISRMIDRQGNDWVAFRRDPWNLTPESAASSYRGIPNTVFQGKDSGCGHPGWDKCVSNFEHPNVIRTVSISGLWEWTWTFYDDHAEWMVLKTDTTRKYWFLYEGPSGGNYLPAISYWGNSDNFRKLYDRPDHLDGKRITGDWQTVFFGREDKKYVLFLHNCSDDSLTDSFSYMGSNDEGIIAKDTCAK